MFKFIGKPIKKIKDYFSKPKAISYSEDWKKVREKIIKANQLPRSSGKDIRQIVVDEYEPKSVEHVIEKELEDNKEDIRKAEEIFKEYGIKGSPIIGFDPAQGFKYFKIKAYHTQLMQDYNLTLDESKHIGKLVHIWKTTKSTRIRNKVLKEISPLWNEGDKHEVIR